MVRQGEVERQIEIEEQREGEVAPGGKALEVRIRRLPEENRIISQEYITLNILFIFSYVFYLLSSLFSLLPFLLLSGRLSLSCKL